LHQFTFVFTVAELSVFVGSNVVLAALALSEIVAPELPMMFTTKVSVTLLVLARVAEEQVTVPVPPAGGVTHVQQEKSHY
jgi:hypothetical protein